MSSRLLKNTRLLRYTHPASLQRTCMCASFRRISRALHLDGFEQPAENTFSTTWWCHSSWLLETVTFLTIQHYRSFPPSAPHRPVGFFSRLLHKPHISADPDDSATVISMPMLCASESNFYAHRGARSVKMLVDAHVGATGRSPLQTDLIFVSSTHAPWGHHKIGFVGFFPVYFSFDVW